jgi:hypothetical protein
MRCPVCDSPDDEVTRALRESGRAPWIECYFRSIVTSP